MSRAARARLFALILLLSPGFCQAQTGAKPAPKKIGIILFNDSTHYHASLNGIVDKLAKEGFKGDKVDIYIRDAKGLRDEVRAIAREFKNKHVDILMPIGTGAALDIYNTSDGVPVVFCMVFDPVGAGLVKTLQNPGGNATGATNWADLKAMTNVFRQIAPVRKMGVIYTQTELNSVLQLEQLQNVKKEMNFEVLPANLLRSEDAKSVSQALARNADCVFITGSNVASSNLDEILAVFEKAGIPTVSHLKEYSQRGVLLTVSTDSYLIGELAGMKAAQVLRGIPPGFITVETMEQLDITVNLKTAKKSDINISDALLGKAANIIR